MILEIKELPRKPKGRGSPPRIMVLKCDVCGNIYERPYSKHHFSEPLHRCGVKCVYGSRSTDGLGGHGAIIKECPCATCGTQIRVQACYVKKNENLFCDRKCYGKWRSTHREIWAKSIELMHSHEVRAKAIKTRSQHWADGTTIHPRLGKQHTDETKSLMKQRHEENPHSGERNGMFGRNHTDESRAQMSDTRTKRILSGEIVCYPGHTRHGNHFSPKTQTNMYFKSGWEEKFMKHLDENVDVATYEFESTRIQYYYRDNKRWYVPDFLITYVDGSRRMVEIKPKEFIKTEKNLLKTDAGRAHCAQNDIQEYVVLTGDDLRKLQII